ncbi:GNAT family N-acetyltransferase [Methylocystis iwaonis]|uniref:GNAT family N-acetyltransferase n=1 Tax=Methylocystis iwaonis TaxID=2885079 RepID=UPI002E7B6B35|nr:GNAT family N-acetyltransferase [Methylocystis iwaonis]
MDESYSIRELSEAEFEPLFDKHKFSMFAGVHSYDIQHVLTDAEQQRIKELEVNLGAPYKLYLGVFDIENEFVGWSWGKQENASTFYMVSSAVLERHRHKGIYSALIAHSIERLSKAGFQLVYSRHCATNNDVIIPKLKAGFIISKMEIDDRYGVLIHLHYYTNSYRRRIMDYRSGQETPDLKIKQVFGLA